MQRKKNRDFTKKEQLQICKIILLNRILQTQNSPSRKTQKEIANYFDTNVSFILRLERFICSKLLTKSSILLIMLDNS